jgi:DNA end-binding protein Ku
MPRSITSAVIRFGLLSIPVKFYTSASAVKIEFNHISPAGNRVKQKLVDSVTGADVDHEDLHKGYEVSKEQYVIFTREELKTLDAECEAKTLDIVEFVDAPSIDPVAIEKTYFLGPDKGGDRALTLLSEAMTSTGHAAVGQWNTRGKEHLVVIRPYRGGLILHQMFYAHEVRDFGEIETNLRHPLSDQERKMATKLVSMLSSGTFDPTKYQDTYSERLKQAIDEKLGGGTLTAVATPAVRADNVLDLTTLLQQSLAEPPKTRKSVPKAPPPKKGKK